MHNVTIVFSTIGSARTKKRLSPKEQHAYWRQIIRGVIQENIASARRAGCEPRILIVDSSNAGIPAASIKFLADQARKVGVTLSSIHRPGSGLMEGFMEGARYAIQDHQPSALVMSIDDYQTEAKSLGNLLGPFFRTNNSADFVTGKWINKSAYSFLRPQLINETMMSRLTTFANPNVPVKDGSFAKTVQNALKTGNGVQTYTTFTAMTPAAFEKLDRYISNNFRDAFASIKMIGLEPLMLAAAYAKGLRVENAPITRRFEHSYPKNKAQEVAFLQSRRKQFEEGARALRAFLEKSGQIQKIPIFDAIVSQTIQRLTPITGKKPLVRWRAGSKKRLQRIRQFRKKLLKK